MINYTKLPNPSAVGAGQTATLSIPVGLTYFGLDVVMTNNGADVTDWSIITELRLSLNGRVKVSASGAFLATLADYYGWSRAAGILPIRFARDYLRTAIQENYLAWGTADLDSFTLEIEIAATAVAPTVNIYAARGIGTPLGQHVEINSHAFEIASAGEREFSDFPRVQGGMLALHLDTAAVDAVDTIRDQVRVQELTAPMMKALAQGKGRWPRSWQAGFTHMDYHLTDVLGHILPTDAQDLRLRIYSQAGAIGSRKLYYERLVGQAPAGGV